MQTFEEDLDPVKDKRSPEEEGVGVVGRRLEPWPVGRETESESLAVDEEESSRVWGTKRQVFTPRASFTFLHLLPIIIVSLSMRSYRIL